MTTLSLIVISVICGIYLAGRVIVWASYRACWNKTGRMLYVNWAWSQAKAKDIYYGVQCTSQQAQANIGGVLNELEVPSGWTSGDIVEMEASRSSFGGNRSSGDSEITSHQHRGNSSRIDYV